MCNACCKIKTYGYHPESWRKRHQELDLTIGAVLSSPECYLQAVGHLQQGSYGMAELELWRETSSFPATFVCSFCCRGALFDFVVQEYAGHLWPRGCHHHVHRRPRLALF